MVVFLLFVIIALLLFGGAAFLRLGLWAFKASAAVLLFALLLGFLQGVPPLILWAAAFVLIAGTAGACLWVFVRSEEDTLLLKSDAGRALFERGLSAQEVVDFLKVDPTWVPEPPRTAAAPSEAVASPPPGDAPGPVSVSRDLIRDDLDFSARIEYADRNGEVTVRTVNFHSAYGVAGAIDRLDGHCRKRRADRSFLLSGILSIRDRDTGLEWDDPWEWLQDRLDALEAEAWE